MVYKSVQMKPKEYLPCSEWSEFGGNKSFISSHKSNFSLRLLSCRQLDPLVLHNNSKSVAFHTTVPMWSFNWSWYFNERRISVLRANYERKYFSLFGLLLQFPRHHCHFYVNTWRNFVYYDYEPVSFLL